MYLLRRVFKCKPRTTRQAAELITKIGQAYMNAGQRGPIRVYFSGGTITGPADTVYMDWIQDAIEPPNREGNEIPRDEIGPLWQKALEFIEEDHLELYQMFEPR